MVENKKKSFPLASIGIPFYNSATFIGDAISSVINQTYTNWELLLIDDGSHDNSLEIANAFKNKDSRIIVISDGKNKGLPERLNQLTSLIKGQYYFRMDADDIMHPKRLEKQIEFLIRNPEVDLVGSALISIDNNNHILGKRSLSTVKNYNIKELLKGNWSVHPTIAGKSDWFRKNPYDIRLKRAQDFDLWLRTIDNSIFKKLELPLLFYREASTPSLKKYYISTRSSMLIYWKNRKILGVGRSFIFVLVKLLKLGVYFLYNLFNATNRLIERRSEPLNKKETFHFKSLLSNARQTER